MQDRRTFTKSFVALAVATLLGCREHACEGGLLTPDPDGVLELANGLTYVVLQRKDDRMSDGLAVPRKPDGMACFERGDQWVLMRNQEIGSRRRNVEYAHPHAFDAAHYGGVTRVVVDPSNLAVVESNQVLTGTKRNCGGGVTPHGWLSCEETTDEGHGWVFLCDVDATSTEPPVMIEGYGRFKHEAAVFDATTGICYLTEDENDSCLFRFVPEDIDDPFGRGRLEALAVVGDPRASTTNFEAGESFAVEWVPVPDPTGGEGAHESAIAEGAAKFVRGEGAWLEGERLVFAATSGGPGREGQIFELDIRSQVLTCLVVASEHALYKPDNVAIGPDGSIWICEDTKCQCALWMRAPDGRLHLVARASEPENELAGVCFSPDGQVLFVNLWGTGETVAILGIGQLLAS